jgi:hypothetical protein
LKEEAVTLAGGFQFSCGLTPFSVALLQWAIFCQRDSAHVPMGKTPRDTLFPLNWNPSPPTSIWSSFAQTHRLRWLSLGHQQPSQRPRWT